MEEQLLSFLEKLLRAAVELVERKRYKRGLGAVLGAVAGRPLQEDVELQIDRECEELFRRHLRTLCREQSIAVKVYSEHGTYLIGRGKAAYLCSIDPFDGSGLFKRGWPAEWFSVLSFFAPDGTPVAGGVADILRRELFLANVPEKQVLLLNLGHKTRETVTPSLRTTVDNETKFAAYLMDPSYLIGWVDRMRPALTFPGIRIWPNGGSCIYAWLAMARVDAYVMFNEPRSEIDPGLAFASAAGLSLLSVTEDGAVAPYEFLLGRQAERVPFFIAACTRELGEEIAARVVKPKGP